MSNPHFIFNKSFYIIENDLFEINNAFDIYSLQKDKTKIYVCGGAEFWRAILDIFEFKGNSFEKILSLKNHKEFITNCKYYLNKKLLKEYLVSTDSGKSSSNTIIWEIIDEKKYEEILNVENKDSIRYPSSLIFNYNNDNNNQLFLIHPISQVDSEIITENNQIFKKIHFTNGKILHYLIWENNKNNKNYIIQCNTNIVYIYDIFSNDKNFIKIENEAIYGNNYAGHILYNKNNTDILCIVNDNGNIIFYDLFANEILSIIKIKDDDLVNVCQFNDNYLIFLSKKGFFMVFDYKIQKIINKIGSPQLSKIKTIKMINHDIYGKYILIGGFMKGLLLYENVKSIKIIRKNDNSQKKTIKK